MIILIKSTLKLDVKWESSNFGIRLLLSFRLSLSQKSIDILSKALCPSNSKKNKGLPRTKHDMTAVCQQRIFFLHLFCFIISRVKYAFQMYEIFWNGLLFEIKYQNKLMVHPLPLKMIISQKRLSLLPTR